MASEPSFDGLMQRLHTGDQQAADQIFQQYAGRLINLAASRLGAAIKQKVDPEEVMLSAFRSFFVHQAQGQFDLKSWDGLWSLLAVITLRKCGHKVKHFRAARRDIRREIQQSPAGEDYTASWAGIARDPTPSEAAILAETLEQILGEFDVQDRSIIELILQGHSAQEVSLKVGRAERTVFRVLERVKQKLHRHLAEDADEL